MHKINGHINKQNFANLVDHSRIIENQTKNNKKEKKTMISIYLPVQILKLS